MKRLFIKARFLFVALTFAAPAVSLAVSPEAVPGEYVVKFKDSVSVKSLNLSVLGQELGSYVKSTIPDQNIVVIKRPVFEMQTSVLKTLAQNPEIEVIEPNFIYRASRNPNDPMLGELWGMHNSGQNDSSKQPGVAGVDIGAVEAWDIETGSRDVIIAVIDTGVDYTNPDLAPNMWTNDAELRGQPGVDDDGNGVVDDIYGYNAITNGGDPKDDQGHGSHCSGTIGAKGDDGKGIVGVAWNTRIMAVKFLDKNGSGTLENAIKGIDYATKMGARIMSNSWGGGGVSQTLKEAIERSHKAGALFVAAAGNEANNNDASPSYPASYQIPNVLSVAAVDNKGQIASFSNYGKTSVHVAAPGVNILSTTPDGYDSWSGTSMATPHVSGIAVLLASHEPQLTSLEIKNRIITTSHPLPALRGKVRGAGFANAYSALTDTLSQPDVNDPANWKTITLNVSSAHPYKGKSQEVFEVRIPGAKEFALYFDKFQTERGYDIVQLMDAQGKLIAEISGSNDESYSPTINGDYVKVVFKSDDSVNRYGFDITKAAWR